MHRLWQHDERIRLASPVEQWPRDAVLARHLLAQAQEKLRNRDVGRRASVRALARASDCAGTASAGPLPPALPCCPTRQQPLPPSTLLQGGTAAAAGAAPAPAEGGKATPYAVSTEELRRKNREVGRVGWCVPGAAGHCSSQGCWRVMTGRQAVLAGCAHTADLSRTSSLPPLAYPVRHLRCSWAAQPRGSRPQGRSPT